VSRILISSNQKGKEVSIMKDPKVLIVGSSISKLTEALIKIGYAAREVEAAFLQFNQINEISLSSLEVRMLDYLKNVEVESKPAKSYAKFLPKPVGKQRRHK
jgi:hypothetical protein